MSNPGTKLLALVEAADRSKAVRPMLKDWHRVVQLRLGDNTYEIAIAGGSVSLRPVSSERPDLSFDLSEETLDDLLTEKLTPLAAKMKGKIRSTGSIIDILRFASILTTSAKALNAAGPKSSSGAGT